MNYLTLLEVADLLSEQLTFEYVTAGAADSKLTESISVYQRSEFMPRKCIGTEPSYETANIRLLIRWGKNPTQAESKASEIGEIMQTLRETPTAAHIIKYTDVKAIHAIGKDEKGVCEYVVDADIIYSERNDL